MHQITDILESGGTAKVTPPEGEIPSKYMSGLRGALENRFLRVSQHLHRDPETREITHYTLSKRED